MQIMQMCCNIVTPRKAQRLEGLLPNNWRFYFDEQTADTGKTGLLLIRKEEATRYYRSISDQNRKTFKSFEDAASHDPDSFRAFDALPFYDAIGIFEQSRKPSATATAGNLQQEKENHAGTRDVAFLSQHGASQYSVAEDIPSEIRCSYRRTSTADEVLSLPEIRRRKCGNCQTCVAGDCGKCESCRSNKSKTRREKDACLQRMCINIPEETRRQEAKGFPPGWKFTIGRHAVSVDRPMDSLSLVSPSGIVFKSAAAACRRHPKQLENLQLCEFCSQTGLKMLENIVDDPLLGKGFMNEWLNVNGDRVCIFGKVIEVFGDLADQSEHKYRVRYGKLREKIVDTTGTSLSIPETQEFTHERALGGCLMYEALMSPSKQELACNSQFCSQWVVPHSMNRLMYNYREKVGDQWVRLPLVRIEYKGFQLTFKVKDSTIPDAGYGVFLSAKSWDASDRQFILSPGELLDFGIYAPLRPEDRRNDHEFLMKTFVHSFSCSDYSFETQAEPDSPESDIFDITDDCTGDLHAIARRHVTPYVNEIAGQGEVATVHARYDCEGALHYVLGHERQDQGTFVLECSDDDHEVDMEIFVDYGDKYENVRLRQGYPRLSIDDAEKERLLKKDEIEYLQEINTFNANEVKSTLGLFASMLQEREKLNAKVILRTILVLLLLKRRIHDIFVEFEGIRDDESVCDNGGRDTVAVVETIRHSTKLIEYFVNEWGNSEDLLGCLRDEEMYVEGLCMVFDADTVASVSPREFVTMILRESW